MKTMRTSLPASQESLLENSAFRNGKLGEKQSILLLFSFLSRVCQASRALFPNNLMWLYLS